MSSRDDLVVDTLGTVDVDDAYALSRLADWPTRKADWRRYVDLPNVDALAGRVGDRLVGTVTVVRYGTAVAWIGMLLVHPDYRRRGYGRRLFRAAVEAAREGGAELLGLDANDEGRPIYEEAGFRPVGTVREMAGELAGDSDSPDAVVSADDPAVLADIDRTLDAPSREFLFASLLEDDGAVAFRTTEGRGFATVRPMRDEWFIGPVTATSQVVTRNLLSAVSEHLGDAPAFVGVPATNATGTIYREFGFSERRTLTRMTRPSRSELWLDRDVRAIAGYEFG